MGFVTRAACNQMSARYHSPMWRSLKSALISFFIGALLQQHGESAEITFQTVAIIGSQAPGITNGAIFSNIDQENAVSIDRNGLIAFGAKIQGAGISNKNNSGLWAGPPSNPLLVIRAADPLPEGGRLDSAARVVLGGENNLEFLYGPAAEIQALDDWSRRLLSRAILSASSWFLVSGPHSQNRSVSPSSLASPNALKQQSQELSATDVLFNDPFCLAGTNWISSVEFTGEGVNQTNVYGLAAGSTSLSIVARDGSLAPGAQAYFYALRRASFVQMLDGHFAFSAFAQGPPEFVTNGVISGVWYGTAENVSPIILSDTPVPTGVLNGGEIWANPEGPLGANSRGEIAIMENLKGPSIVHHFRETDPVGNDKVIVAGRPGAFRIVARNGEPAPGLTNEVFFKFNPGFGGLALGGAGDVAFVATYNSAGSNYGIWLAPSNGPARLVAHSEGQAPGTPDGTVFSSSDRYLPPWEKFYVNARGQVAFTGLLGGTGINETNRYGIWLSEPDGSVNLVARTGDLFDLGTGEKATLADVDLVDPSVSTAAGGEDGKPTPLGPHGELVFWARWFQKPSAPLYSGFGEGIFIARNGIILSAEKIGSEIHLVFSTTAQKHYRVEQSQDLALAAWSPVGTTIVGTGSKVTVTNSAFEGSKRFYRVVETD